MIPIRDVFPVGSPNSPYGPVFTRTVPVGTTVALDDANVPGLGGFLPCWALLALTNGERVDLRISGESVAPGLRLGGCVPLDGVSVSVTGAGTSPSVIDVVPVRASIHAMPMSGQSIYLDAQAISATASGQTVTEDTFPALRRFSWMMALATGSSTAWDYVTTTGSGTRSRPLAFPLDGSVRSSAAQTATVRRAMISHIMPRARVIGGEAGSLLGPRITGPSIAAGASLILTEATVPGLTLPGFYFVFGAVNVVLEYTPDAGTTWRVVTEAPELTPTYLVSGVFRIRNGTATAQAPQFMRLAIT